MMLPYIRALLLIAAFLCVIFAPPWAPLILVGVLALRFNAWEALLTEQICPFCHNKTLVLHEDLVDIPYFGKTYVFSMSCQDSDCNYFKSDVESEETKDPCKITFAIKKEEDLNIRVVKSSQATIKIPQLRMSVTPGPGSNGYVSNIEGILNRFKKILEDEMDLSEDDSVK